VWGLLTSATAYVHLLQSKLALYSIAAVNASEYHIRVD